MGVVKYTGPVASFHCPTNAEIRSLKVHFSPRQEGTGDPSPENIRNIVGWDGVITNKTGKNILEISSNSYYTDSNAAYEILPNGVKIYNTTAGTYRSVSFKTPILNQYRGQKLTLSMNMSNTTGRRIIGKYRYSNGDAYLSNLFELTDITVNQTITIPSDLPDGIFIQLLFYCTSSSSETNTVTYTNIQLEVGENATSYEPYQDSTTDYEFGVLGKNKLDPTWVSGSINTNTGSAQGGSNNIRLKDKIKVFPGATYTISWSSTGRNIYRFAYKKDGTFSRYLGLQSVNSQAIKFNADEYYLWIYQYNNINEPENIQVELGSTATTYEPYDPKHTVYGGWVDLISGEVRDNWWKVSWDIGADQGTIQTSGLRRIAKSLPSAHLCDTDKRTKAVCSQLLYSSQNGDLRPNFSLSSNTAYIYIPNDSTAYTFEILYPSQAVTATYHLAPTQLSTFLGQNNVWSNADCVEVEYDLHETQDILARKQFIMANQPHVETLAPAPLQSFSTDMVAPLKECKVYFEPVQEGSGDASPENVRNISGWNEMTISQSQGQVIQDATNEDWTVGWLTAGGILNASASYRTSDYIPVSNGATVKIKFTNQTSERKWYCIAYYDSQKKFLVRNNQGYTTEDITCTVSYEGLEYIRISINRASDILISVGPITTDLIDWSSAAGTVYGGYIDLISGTLYDGWDIVDMGDLNWTYYTNNTYPFFGSSTISQANKYGKCLCSYYEGVEAQQGTYWTVYNNPLKIGFNKLGGSPYVRVQDSTCTDAASFKTMVTGQKLAFELATPIIHQLTPTQLKSLRGTNNIWSNANGNIELKYWTH